MRLPDKIIALRKSKAMSQEALAEELGLSRQAVSRWETGAAMPDAVNILQLSKLFGVTADYLLNDDYRSDDDLPKVRKAKADSFQLALTFLVTLEVVVLILQFVSVIVLQNELFGAFSLISFVVIIGGFEYIYRRNADNINEESGRIRRTFYKVSAWLGSYFPVRLLVSGLAWLWPRPYSSLALEIIIVLAYLGVATLATLLIGKRKPSRTRPLS